ncbi:MAG: penicillin-binding protein 2, partial [Paludibacteraceae bacterium]|nr:penicillin-binding protein 2 [Paludibacteraceae bacterium]
QLIVSNQPFYDVMLIMREMHDFDTTASCKTLDITRAEFDRRIDEIKDRSKNPSYSRYTPQVFLSQLSGEDYGRLQEHLFRFSGTFIQQRVLREYTIPHGAHAIGSIGEVNRKQIEEDAYYKQGDYKGQSGIEKTYEEQLRGEKGVEILLRDVHGRIKGRYKDGERDEKPVVGKNVTVGLDIDLQAYGEKLMDHKLGSVVCIEPSSGEILALVSSPGYDPSLLVGRKRSKNYAQLLADPKKPLFDRPMMAQYPPGSTFKLVMSLVLQQEGIISPNTAYPCYQGYYYTRSRKLGCHAHASPLRLEEAIQHSCNAYFCYGLHAMLDNHLSKYGRVDSAYQVWRDHVVSMGFGAPLGVDFPNEKGGFIPTVDFYNKYYGKGGWRSSTIISLSIGQGEILATPLQTANLAATIANGGWFYTPHILKSIEGDSIDARYRTRHYTTVDSTYYRVVKEGMARAVAYGTARIGQIEGMEFCGKTGTAQNPHGKDHSIFIGFAPKDDPKIAVAVYVENSGFGATWAVPIASLMIEKYLNDTISDSRRWLEQRMLDAHLDGD